MTHSTTSNEDVQMRQLEFLGFDSYRPSITIYEHICQWLEWGETVSNSWQFCWLRWLPGSETTRRGHALISVQESDSQPDLGVGKQITGCKAKVISDKPTVHGPMSAHPYPNWLIFNMDECQRKRSKHFEVHPPLQYQPKVVWSSQWTRWKEWRYSWGVLWFTDNSGKRW